MKIALTCPASLPATQFGGILFLAVDIARMAAKKGHDVTIYTTDLDFSKKGMFFNKKLADEEKIEGFVIKRSHVVFALKLFFVNPKIFSQLKQDKPEIIHSIGIRSFQTLISALVSKIYKIPLIISDQGGLYTHPDYSKGMLKILYRIQDPMIKFVISQTKKIIVSNEYEHSIFKKYCGESKLVIIRNGIDFEQLQKFPNDFKTKYQILDKFILFIGRFSLVKGVDLLLDSFAKICKLSEYNEIVLVIMGIDFGYRDHMFKKIIELNLQDRVKVVEKPPREYVIAAYHASEFLVLPSRWEMSPLTPLEAFACKKPVVSINTHGIPYVIKHNENGLLVQPENIELLTNAIIELLQDKEKAKKLGQNGFEWIKNSCTSQKMIDEVLKVYNQYA